MSEKIVSAGKQQRSEEIARLQGVFESVEGGVLADFRGLKVKDMSELRNRLREQGASFKVVKNTLARLAVEQTNLRELGKNFAGPTGVAFAHGDAIAVARAAVEFAKDNDALEIKAGFLDGRVLNKEQILELSKLSSKQDLLAQFLSVLNAPAQKFLGVLNGVPQKFLGVLEARAQQMEGA